MNQMQFYIDEQPELLKRMLESSAELTAPVIKSLAGQPVERIVLIGSGSSYHAALMAKPVIERALGIEVTAIIPTRFEELRNMKRGGTAFFATSQSGNSTNTFDCIATLHTEGCLVTAITADPSSPVAKAADLSLCLPIGEETIGAKTKGMMASALLLTLLGLELGRARQSAPPAFYEAQMAALHSIFAAMEDNLTRSKAWCTAVVPQLAESGYIDIISEGAAAGAAAEGRLKLLETIWRPVIHYEFEEYLHGIQNALSEKTYLLAILPDEPEARARMCRLLGFAREKGAHCFAAGRGACMEEPDALVLTQHSDALICGFELLPAMQTLSAQLSAYCGIDVTKPKFPDFYGIMKSKLRV